jgi:hypothetical protein
MEAVRSFSQPEELIRQRVQEIHQDLLAHSHYIRESDFTKIHTEDLKFLFGAYDERFCSGLLQRALDGRTITFRLSQRMTSTGGTTTRFPNGKTGACYEIALAVGLLFDGFREGDRRITVSGLECKNRLEALQRIFEHEIVHLIEFLCWESSYCAAARFQNLARRLFLHRAHTHHLVTTRERAADSGIRRGSRVTFLFEGHPLIGRVSRITKRATVLVEDAAGRAYSDGRRYKVYYVPLPWLQTAAVDVPNVGSHDQQNQTCHAGA